MMIKYNGVNIHAMADFKGAMSIHGLRPGWNEFPQHVWEQNKDNDTIKKFLEDGTIELMAEKVVVQEGKKKTTKILGIDDNELRLTELPEHKAIKVAKDTFNREILQRWIDEETRHKVKRALVDQLDSVVNPKQDQSTR
jgi:hypothetical protein